jgi:hypothetical protein
LIRGLLARFQADARATFDEVGAPLANGGYAKPENEKLLHATCHVLGQHMIVYDVKKKKTRDALREDPRWIELVAAIIDDERVHAHFREGALTALAATGDAKWIPLVAKNASVADAMTLASAVRDLGDGAADAVRANLDARTAEELDVWLEQTAKRKKKKR